MRCQKPRTFEQLIFEKFVFEMLWIYWAVYMGLWKTTVFFSKELCERNMQQTYEEESNDPINGTLDNNNSDLRDDENAFLFLVDDGIEIEEV